MPPALIMCLALVGALFFAAVVGMAYFQMKLDDPKKDGYFKLQKDVAESFGIGAWANFQRSKAVRVGSFVVSLVMLVSCLTIAAWYGFQTILLISANGN